MDFTDGLQKLALIPRSHFQPCNSRGAPQRSLTKEGLQSPGSTHVKYCAQHQRQEGHFYRDRTGSYKAGAVEGQRPTSHTSPHGRNNVQLALQNHTMGFGTQQHFCSERGYRERRGRPPTLLLQHREIKRPGNSLLWSNEQQQPYSYTNLCGPTTRATRNKLLRCRKAQGPLWHPQVSFCNCQMKSRVVYGRTQPTSAMGSQKWSNWALKLNKQTKKSPLTQRKQNKKPPHLLWGVYGLKCYLAFCLVNEQSCSFPGSKDRHAPLLADLALLTK